MIQAKIQTKILTEITELTFFPCPAREFHLCQIIDVYVGTIWCKVVDEICVVVIKCCKWTKLYRSFRSLCNVRRQKVPSFFATVCTFSSAAMK